MDNSAKPLVSVLMTSYNREKYIAEAIESVLASAYTNFELIIVDDCSKDDTLSIAKKYEKKNHNVKVYLNEKNLGDYPNRNKAAFYSKGKYLKYLDSDDVMYPHCLEIMVSAMEQFPEAGFGLSAIDMNMSSAPICLFPQNAYTEHFEGKGHFYRAPGSSIINKEAFHAVGGFSGIRQVGDFEFWLKIGCYYPLVKLPVDLYWSRSHKDQERNVHNKNEKKLLYLQVLNKIFQQEKVPLTDQQKIKAIASLDRKNNLLKKIFKLIYH